jgi:hypothetical protein
MDKQNFNLDNIKESSYIDKAGKYTLTIKSYKSEVSQNGKEFHRYECESTDGGKISVTLYLIDNAMWKYKAFMKACGLSGTGVVNLDTLPQTLVGKQFIGEVQRQPDKLNLMTGLKEESKYFEVAKFYPVAG